MSINLPDGLSARFWRTFEPRANIRDALQPGEEWIGSWDNIGLYEGNNKIPSHQTLLIHLTTHRLLVLPSPVPDIPHSFSSSPKPIALQCHLSGVRQTELYAGFMRSSPKITIFLGPTPSSSGEASSSSPVSPSVGSSSKATGDEGETKTWTCGVCGTVNKLPPHSFGDVPSPSTPCTLCGVSYAASRASHIPPTRTSTPVPDRPTPVPLSLSMPGPSPLSPKPTALSSPTPPPDPPETGKAPPKEISCPACTFLNHPTMTSCEICGTALPKRPSVLLNGVATGSNITGGTRGSLDSAREATTERLEVVRLSFRKGGVNEAYKKLKSVLGTKSWEATPSRSGQRTGPSSPTSGSGVSTPRGTGAGIDGILQSISLDAKAQDESMASAFQDLEILMVRAGEMVRLAQNLNAKLNALPPDQKPSEEEATLIRSSLVQLGLPTPALTPDMVKSDRDYHEGLARELGHLLTGGGVAGSKAEGLMVGRDGRGVLGLDEVWGLWMRARGVSLLSPSSLHAVLPHLPAHTSPSIRSMTLPSGLLVLYSPTYAPTTILARLLSLLLPSPPADGARGEEPSLNIIEIAAHEGLPIGLAKELMEEVEKLRLMPSRALHGVDGVIRDEQGEQGSGGVRWYRDIISSWPVEAI